MTETTSERVGKEAANGLDDATEAADRIERRVRSRLSDTAAQLEARYRELSEEAERLVANARKEATKRYGELQEKVKEQPEVGVAIGFVAGLLVAMMLSGSHRTIVVRDHH